MLDTNICIYIIKKRPVEVIQRLLKLKPSDVFISSITLAELEYGVQKSGSPVKNRLALAAFTAPLSILPFDDVSASKYGEIRACLESKGNMIGPYDALIAAHALACGLTLVTNNENEFRRVQKLKIENWVV